MWTILGPSYICTILGNIFFFGILNNFGTAIQVYFQKMYTNFGISIHVYGSMLNKKFEHFLGLQYMCVLNQFTLRSGLNSKRKQFRDSNSAMLCSGKFQFFFVNTQKDCTSLYQKKRVIQLHTMQLARTTNTCAIDEINLT